MSTLFIITKINNGLYAILIATAKIPINHISHWVFGMWSFEYYLMRRFIRYRPISKMLNRPPEAKGISGPVWAVEVVPVVPVVSVVVSVGVGLAPSVVEGVGVGEGEATADGEVSGDGETTAGEGETLPLAIKAL